MAEPAQQPERLRNETARRALETGGPATMRALRLLTGASPDGADQHIVELPRQEQILEQALGAMSREAARLLYVGAKSALEADPVYRVLQDRSPGGDPEPWPAVRERAERLDRRARGLGAPDVRRWPTSPPGADAASGHRLADECVRLAEAIRPGWEWTQLMRGIVLKARGQYDEALHCLRPLADKGFDYEVRYWGQRNVLMGLAATQSWDELQHRVSMLERLSRGDVAVAYFELELWAARRQSDRCLKAADQLRDRAAELSPYWATMLSDRLPDLGKQVPGVEQDLGPWLRSSS